MSNESPSRSPPLSISFVFSVFSRIQNSFPTKQTHSTRRVFEKESAVIARSFRSCPTRRPIYSVVYVCPLKERALRNIHYSFIHLLVHFRTCPNVYFFPIFLLRFLIPPLELTNERGAKLNARECGKERKWRGNVVYTVCKTSVCTPGTRLSHLADVRYRFSIRERCARDDSSNNIITGHCGVFLLFPSLPFFFLRVGLDQVYLRSEDTVRDTFTLDHP